MMPSSPDGTDDQPAVDKPGLIGGVAELAAHVFSVVARILVR